MNITHGIKLLKVLSLLGAFVVITFALSPSAEAAVDKLDVCHVTNVPTKGDGHVISIADPAWPAHEEHGDKMLSDQVVTVSWDGTTCHVSTVIEAIDDEVTTPAETAVTIDVLANDIYDDLGSVSVQVFPQYGTLGIVDVGIFEYTPNSGYVGTDSFIYRVCDTGGQCDTATVIITVSP